MANPYTDPRYALARMMASKPAAPPIGSSNTPPVRAPSRAAIQLGRAANDLALGNPSMQERLRSIAEGGSGQNPKGLAGTVLGNPLTKGALNALNVIAIPGRAVVAGFDELGKTIDYDPNTKASASTFFKNVKDVEYGFGKAFNPNTGSIWLDRAIGFVGDVALDPLTYATFGVGKFAGYGGRLDLANAVGKITNDAALVNRVQRFGRTADGMTPELLEAVGANRYGLHFLGKRIKVGQFDQGLRLPGSGAVGYMGEKAMARLRIMASDSKLGQAVSKVTLPGDFIEARRALAQGKLGDDTATALVSFFNADPVQRIEAGRVLQEQRTRLAELFEREKGNGLEGYKNSLTDLLEDDAAFAAASPELQRAASVYKNIFSEFEDNVFQALKSVDETIDPTARFRQNYFPRMVTDRGLNLLSDPTHPFGSQLRAIFSRDPLAGGRNFKARMLEPGDVFFGKELTEADLVSTTKLNQIARDAGFGGDFFETDITKVLTRYIDEYAKEMGILAKHKHLVETGFWKRVQELKVDDQFVDDELVSALKKRVGTLDNELARSAKTTAEALRSLEGAIKESKLKIGKQIKEAEQSLKELEAFEGIARTADDILNEGIDLTEAGLQQVVDQMGTLKKKFVEMLGLKLSRGGKIIIPEGVAESDVPMLSESMVSLLSRVEASVAAAKSNLDLVRSGKQGADLEKVADDLTKDIKRIQSEVESARTTMQNTIQYGAMLNDALEGAVSGDVSKLTEGQMLDLGALLSPSTGADRVFDIVQGVVGGTAGDAQTYLRGWLNDANSVYARLTSASPAEIKDSIAKMSKSDFEAIVQRAFDSKVDPNELRMAAFFALGMDAKLYGAQAPEAVSLLRTELEGALEALDNAMAYHSKVSVEVARGERITANKIFEEQIKESYARVVDAIEDLSSLSRLQDEEFFGNMRRVVEENPEALDVVLTPETIEPFFKKYPILRDLFESDPIDEIRALMNEDAYVYKAHEMSPVPPPMAKDLTIGEFLDTIDNMVKTKSGILNQPAYSFGSGVSERAYTGMELKVMVDRYNELVEESKKIQRLRREYIADNYNETDGPILELEIKKLLESGVQESDSLIVGLNRRVDAAMQQSRNLASTSEYDDVLYQQLERVGYFRETDRIKKAKLRAEAETEYAFIKKDREQITRKGVVRSGTFSIGDKETEIADAIREISGGGGLVRPEGFDGLEQAQAKFAESLMQYTVVSEVHSRYNAVSSILAGFNQAPTERMVRNILNVVGSKHLARIDSKIESFRRAEVILRQLDIDVATSLRTGTMTPNDAFLSALNALPESQRAILREAIGTQMAWTTDPRDLIVGRVRALKGKSTVSPGPQLNPDGSVRVDINGNPLPIPNDRTVAKQVYYRENIEPWFRATYPNERYSMKAADAKLTAIRRQRGGTSRSTVSPFSQEATPQAIKQWFESIIGQSEIGGRRAPNLGEPKLVREVKNFQKIQKQIKTMTSPDLNVGRWLDDPSAEQRTATWYAHLMDGSAKRLREAINAHDRQIRLVDEGQKETAGLSARAQQIDEDITRVTNAVKDIETISLEVEAIQTRIKSIDSQLKTATEKTFLNQQKKTALAELSDAKRRLVAVQQAPKRLRELEERAFKKLKARNEASRVANGLSDEISTIDEQIAIIESRPKPLSTTSKDRLKKLKVQKKKLDKALVDALNKLDQTPALTQGEKEIVSKVRQDASVRRMSEINQQYAELKGNAEYVQATADLEMHQALDVLSDYNLDEFVDGFVIDEVMDAGAQGGAARVKRYVLMPNGERLVFTEAENIALFRSQYVSTPSRGASGIETNVRNAYVRGVLDDLKNEEITSLSRIQLLQNRVAAVDEEIAYTTSWIDNATERIAEQQVIKPRMLGESQSDFQRRVAVETERISQLRNQLELEQTRLNNSVGLKKLTENEMRKLEDYVSVVRSEAASYEDGVLSSALAKIKVLTEGTTVAQTGEVIPPVLGPEGLSKWRERVSATKLSSPEQTVDAATAEIRRGHLNNAWNANPSKKFIDEGERLQQTLTNQVFETMRNDVNGLRARELEMQHIVDKRVADAEKLGEDVIGVRERAMQQARQAQQATEERLGVPVGRTDEDGTFTPLGEQTFDTPESIVEFADVVRAQNEPTGPFVQPLTGAEARRASANVREAYKRKLDTAERELSELIDRKAAKQTITKKRNEINRIKAEARQAIANTRTQAQLEYGIRQKEQAVARRVEAYNAAVESVEEWKKKNPGVIKEAEKALKEQQAILDDVRSVVDRLRKVDQKTIDKLEKTFGGTDAYWDKVNDTRALIADLNEQLATVNMITAMPNEEARSIMMRLSGKKGSASAARADKAIQAYREWMDVNKPVFEELARNPDDPIAKAWANVATAESAYIWDSYRNFGAVEQLMDAGTPVWASRIVEPFAEEWEKAAKASGLYDNMSPGGKRIVDEDTGVDISKGFPGLMGNTEALELLNRMSTLGTPGVVNDLAKFMRGYTGFFRGYATLSPGFHVRNGISNVFSLFAAGADSVNMTRGFAVWKQIQSGVKSGRNIDDIISSIPSDQQEFARVAWRVMNGLGGGRTADALEGFMREGNKITSNAFLEASRGFGNTIEGASRFILAYDSAVKGMDEVTSFNRTGRFLVDYNKKTAIDQTMRDIMPFWVWMSRNLPLQVITRWTNPKPYLMWDKFSKNLQDQDSEDEVVPAYLRGMGAIGLGGGNFLSVDLPFSRIDEQIQGFASPKSLFGNVSPGIKAPIEFLTNTDTFRDRKFPDTYRKVDGALLPFLPLLKALGQVEYDGSGNAVTSEKAYTTLVNLIPPLGRAERLAPSDGGIGGQALRGFFGVPFTNVSEGSREAELYRRLAEVQRVGRLQGKADEAR
jgi:hypothetical protein